MKRLVSVVMPVYNGAKYLSQAIESILSQSFCDYEFIIVDDESTDSSIDIIRNYNDDRIRLLHQKHGGAFSAYNNGFLNAAGEYIVICDQDDISRYDRVEKQIGFLKDNPQTDIVGSYYQIINKNGIVIIERKVPCSHDEIAASIYSKTYSIYNPTVCLRKTVFVKYGYFNLSYYNSCDYEFYLRNITNVKYSNIPEYLYKWRKHQTSIVHNNQNGVRDSLSISLEYLERRECSFTATEFILTKGTVYYYHNYLLKAGYYFLKSILRQKKLKFVLNYLLKSTLLLIPIKIMRYFDLFDSRTVHVIRISFVSYIYFTKGKFYQHLRKVFVLFKNIAVSVPTMIFRHFWKLNNEKFGGGVLIVNTMNLGDLVISLPFVKALLQKHKMKNSFLLISHPYYEFLKQFNLPCSIIAWNKNRYKWNLFYKVYFMRKLNTLGLDVCYNISQERGILNDEIVLNSGAREKICFQKSAPFLRPFFEKRNNVRYTKVLNLTETNEYKKISEIITALGLTIYSSHTSEINLQNETNAGLDLSAPYVVVAPLASDLHRGWGLKNYARLITELSNKIKVIIIGDKRYKTVVNCWIEQKDSVVNLFGQTDLVEATKLISGCSLFVGNDTGLTHLAKFLGKPLVAIIGGGMYGRFFPGEEDNNFYLFHKTDCFGCGWNCIKKNRICLTEVPFKTVHEACLTLLT